MTLHWVPILPEHIWSKIPVKDVGKKYQNTPPYVGSGPFKCVEWKKNNYVRLIANPHWWGPKPAIDEIFFTYYTNGDTMLQDIKAGTIDGACNLVPTQVKQLESDPNIEARAIVTDAFDELAFNCYEGPSKGHPALKDVKFRQAMNYAIDLQKAVDLIMMGSTVPGTTIIPPDYYSDPDWHWEPPADIKYTYDPAKAAELLDAAGYPDGDGDGVREFKGEPIELRLIARSESSEEQQMGKLIAGWFKDVGIPVELSVMDSSTLSDTILNYEGDVLTPDFDMFLWGWYLDYDPGSMLSYFTEAQIGNWSDCFWTDPEYEELYKQQAVELDPNKRKELIDRMQQILYEQSPYIVTDYRPDFEAYNTAKWEGYIAIPHPNGNTLVPPFGNGGYANFLTIKPKTAVAAETSGGGSTTSPEVSMANNTSQPTAITTAATISSTFSRVVGPAMRSLLRWFMAVLSGMIPFYCNRNPRREPLGCYRSRGAAEPGPFLSQNVWRDLRPQSEWDGLAIVVGRIGNPSYRHARVTHMARTEARFRRQRR